jgi:hypothetical protein
VNGEEEEEVEDDEERGGVCATLWWWRWRRKSLSLEALNSVAGNFCLNSKPKDRAGVKDLKRGKGVNFNTHVAVSPCWTEPQEALLGV